MKVIKGLDNAEVESVPRVVTTGVFDGVHRGHQALLETAVHLADEYGAECTVLTFEPAPVEIFSPHNSHNIRLTLEEERHRELEKLEVKTLVVASFDEALRQTSAGDFAEQYLRRLLGAVAVVVSENHTWGREGEGNVDLMKQLGEELGFAVQVIPLSVSNGQPISSSQIRQLLWTGQVSEAAQLLGRLYSLSGTIQANSGRGRQLGFPTANLAVAEAKLVPAPGVYTALVEADELPESPATTNQGGWPAAVSVGASPTFATDTDERLVEAHLLDFQGDLVGTRMTVHFVERLRDQRSFHTAIALKTQIAADISELRIRLKSPDEMMAELD